MAVVARTNPQPLYRVIDVDGDEVMVEFICNLTMPPHTTAKACDLDIVKDDIT